MNMHSSITPKLLMIICLSNLYQNTLCNDNHLPSAFISDKKVR